MIEGKTFEGLIRPHSDGICMNCGQLDRHHHPEDGWCPVAVMSFFTKEAHERAERVLAAAENEEDSSQ